MELIDFELGLRGREFGVAAALDRQIEGKRRMRRHQRSLIGGWFTGRPSMAESSTHSRSDALRQPSQFSIALRLSIGSAIAAECRMRLRSWTRQCRKLT
jgi:hypothetical protein